MQDIPQFEIHDIGSKLYDWFIISDVHLGSRNNSIEWQENIEDYFKNFLIPFIKKNKTDNSVLFILGDLFDDRKSVGIDTLNLAIDLIEELASILPVWVLLGNHDMFKKKDGKINSLRSLENRPNIFIFKKPTVVVYQNASNESIYSFLVPHQGDVAYETVLIQEFINRYGSSNKDCPNLIFTHTDIAGLKYDNNKNINTGVQFKKNANIRIYSGHIHKRQESSRVIYVGSPYHLRRSDIGNTKGIYRIDISDPKKKAKFFPNEYSPVFKRIFYNLILDQPLGEIKKICKNNYIDIVINESDLVDLNVNDLIETLQVCNAKRIEIQVNKNLSGDIECNEEDYKELTLEDLIESNIECMNVQDKTKKILKEMFDYYYYIAKQEVDE